MLTRRLTPLAGAFLGLLSLTLPAAAQRPVLVGFGGGQSYPTGDFGLDNRPGMNIGGFLQYRPGGALMGVRGELSYHRNDMKEALLSELGADPSTTGYWSTLYMGVAGVMEVMPKGGLIGWYLVAGGGLYQIKPTISQAGVEMSLSETKPGFNAGAGMRIRMGGASVFLEGRYHGVKLDDTNYTFMPVAIGLAF